jgi:hypothetical protein
VGWAMESPPEPGPVVPVGPAVLVVPSA